MFWGCRQYRKKIWCYQMKNVSGSRVWCWPILLKSFGRSRHNCQKLLSKKQKEHRCIMRADKIQSEETNHGTQEMVWAVCKNAREKNGPVFGKPRSFTFSQMTANLTISKRMADAEWDHLNLVLKDRKYIDSSPCLGRIHNWYWLYSFFGWKCSHK